MPVGPLTQMKLIEINAGIMSEDPNLTPLINLRQTLVTITETHEQVKKEGKGFYDYPNEKNQFGKNGPAFILPKTDYDEEEVGRLLLPWSSIHKCLDSGVLQEPKDADVGFILD
jgi:3-hydroxyacyl-CoA dehydrogenase/enoyl-CoA hydratase/3-hydroxybutyryl-CoA epimerase